MYRSIVYTFLLLTAVASTLNFNNSVEIAWMGLRIRKSNEKKYGRLEGKWI
jgi:hypothetical protein